MSIRFNMSATQEAALDQLLIDQQNPASPRYHQWLTPAQFAAQFGLSSTDIAKVSAWLTSQGFTVTGVANGGTFVTFAGTVAQAQQAFGTSIHNLSAKGDTHFANVTDVQVPSAIAGVVQAVTGLHNFRFQPRVRASVVKPDFTSTISGSHFVAPGDIYTIYGVNTLAASANGTGETIAVVGQVDIYPADVVAFRSASGLSTTNLPITIHAFGSDPGPPVCNSCTTGANQSDLAEASIDVEWSGAMAPSATIDFVNDINVLPGPTGTDSMTYTIDNNLAPIISDSYGNCEAAWGTTTLNATNALFKQASAQGQTILAAAGDSGATDCDAGPTALEGDTIDFPGSSPYVTSMGGTQFNEGNATGTTTYWSGTTGTTGGSATQYIPEATWNDVTSVDQFGGGGGGASVFFAKPAWQAGTPADASRDVPDISLTASDSHDPFLYCVNVAASGNCTNGYRTASSNLTIAGGTSFDSQIMAGLLALIEQKLNTRLGNINPTLYALGNSSTYASQVFNDVTTGNNAMPCSQGTPDCGNGGVAGFNAVTGYDLANGWGSVNVSNLATNWTKVTPLSGGSLGNNVSVTALTIPPSCPTSGAQCLTTVASGATVTLTATVTGSAGTPTGSMQFLANDIAVTTTPVAVVAGGANTATATYSWPATCSNLGQNVMAASYSGDANYQSSKGPILSAGQAGNTGGTGFANNGSIAVAPVEVQITSTTCPDFAVSTSAATETVAAGGTIPNVTITATPANGFTGTVTFSATVTSTSGYAPTIAFSPASASITSSAAVTTTLMLSGITAGLQMPTVPGKFDPGATVAQGNQGTTPVAREKWYAAGSGVTIASMLLLILPRRRRRLGGLLLVALAVALIGGATGCGGNSQTISSGGTTNTNPYVGTYTVTVIGTFTNATGQATQHITTVTYLVN
jgi:subtilase family serine protease